MADYPDARFANYDAVAELQAQQAQDRAANPQAPELLSAQQVAAKDAEINILTEDGMAYLIDPAGNAKQVPAAQAAALVQKGWQPEGESAVYRREFLEKQRRQMGGGSAFLASAVNASLGGLPSLGGHTPYLAQLEKDNPTASTLGEITGMLSSFAMPGGAMGQLSKGLAGATAKLGTGLAGRVVGKGMQLGLEGVGMAAIQGATATGQGKDVDWGSLLTEGALFNVGLGGAMKVGGATIGKLAKLRGARKAAKVDAAVAKATEKQVKKVGDLSDDLETFWTTERKAAQKALLERDGAILEAKLTMAKPARPTPGGRAERKALKQSVKAWEAESKQLRSVIDGPKAKPIRTKSRVKPSELESELGFAKSALEDARVAAEAAAKAGELTAPGLAEKAGRLGAAWSLLTLNPKSALLSIAGAWGIRQAAKVAKPLGRAWKSTAWGRSAARRASGGFDRAIVPWAFTEADWLGAYSQIAQFDPAEYEQTYREGSAYTQAMSMGVEPAKVEQGLQRTLAAKAYLQQMLPKEPTGGQAAGDARSLMRKSSVPRLTFGAKRTWMLRARAALHPETLLADMGRYRVTSEAVKVWEDLYPDELRELRKTLKQAVTELAGSDGRLSIAQIRTINTVLGVRSSQSLVNLLQSNYAAAAQPPQQSQGGAAPATGETPANTATHLQRALQPGTSL